MPQLEAVDPLPAAQTRELLATLARPSTAYRLHAWLAMAALLGFVLLYFTLAAWFFVTAYRMGTVVLADGKDAFWCGLLGVCTTFLGVFMLKGVFFVQRGRRQDQVELLPFEQPDLFEFLHALADRAGAPRPNKVFVSASVNAAVFYDLSLLNFVFPSKKNLEIGLGLVNVLNLGELRAVLAHEFGHFAQRSMAVGRWVYVTQQIAAQLVARRDGLDDFVFGLSRVDPRIGWIGWVLRLVVWSIRSLVDSAFQLVLLVQRALSREMEMNADLVAVSLAGSDALVHALHRLQAADHAWARAVGFALGEKAGGRLPADVFAIQTQVAGHLGQLLRTEPPALSSTDDTGHRVFQAELAEPPQMWRTHPSNHDRERNAKQRYVKADIDTRSAWELFHGAPALRERITRHFFEVDDKVSTTSSAQSLETLTEQFRREALHPRYQGVYFGRSVTRCVARPDELWASVPVPNLAALDALYPESLGTDMQSLRALEKEVAQLKALRDGRLQAPEGRIQHRGARLKRAQLPETISRVETELSEVRGRLQGHDRHCRSLAMALAQRAGGGWPAYLQGLLAVLHYADHTEDNLRDLQGVASNTVSVVTATSHRVDQAGVHRIVLAANALHRVLEQSHWQAYKVQLDSALLSPWKVSQWHDVLGELKLSAATDGNIGDWLKVVDSWIDSLNSACGALYSHALNQLLMAEATLAMHLRQGTAPGAAPPPSQIEAAYETLLPGQERERQARLGAWARFQTADGLVPATARWLVATAVVGGVLSLAGLASSASVVV